VYFDALTVRFSPANNTLCEDVYRARREGRDAEIAHLDTTQTGGQQIRKIICIFRQNMSQFVGIKIIFV